uniref:Uncharacterized protein n=1 Tax=Anguilla anguilla TaxID=7936 RepID=A0A0E9R7K7_ANGAN
MNDISEQSHPKNIYQKMGIQKYTASVFILYECVLSVCVCVLCATVKKCDITFLISKHK